MPDLASVSHLPRRFLPFLCCELNTHPLVNTQAVEPTMFLGVPRVWEKISEKMKALGKTIKGPSVPLPPPRPNSATGVLASASPRSCKQQYGTVERQILFEGVLHKHERRVERRQPLCLWSVP